jgi:hypothetical protein
MKENRDLLNVKQKEATKEGIKDYFKFKNNELKGSDHDIDDANSILSEELKVKEDLYEKSLKVESFPEHVKPLFGFVFLTAKRNKLTQNGLFLPTASFSGQGDTDLEVDFSDTQIVLSTGDVAEVKEGSEVVLNMDNFKQRLSDTVAQKVQKEYEYVLPVKVIEGVEYLYVNKRDISYVSKTPPWKNPYTTNTSNLL